MFDDILFTHEMHQALHNPTIAISMAVMAAQAYSRMVKRKTSTQCNNADSS